MRIINNQSMWPEWLDTLNSHTQQIRSVYERYPKDISHTALPQHVCRYNEHLGIMPYAKTASCLLQCDQSRFALPSRFGSWHRSRCSATGSRPRNRSGSENLTLAIQSPYSIPWRHGNTACHTPRHVGTAPARSASLYSGTGSACGGIGGHGAGVTRAQPRLAGAAEPDLAELPPPTIKRPAPQRAATPSSESAPSRRSTGAPWPYA